MPERLVLHAADLIQSAIGEPDHVKRVRYEASVGDDGVIGVAVGAGQDPGRHAIRASHASPNDRNQPTTVVASRPGTTSNRRRCAVSQIVVAHSIRRQRPRRQNEVSSRPTAVTAPVRSTSVSNNASL